MKVTVTLQFCQDLVLSVFWILKWLLNFLTCNSLMNCEAKHIFIFYLFAIWTSSFVRWMFRSFDQLLSCYFKGSMYILDHKSFTRYVFKLSQSVAWHPIVFSVYFVEVFILISFNLIIILFCILCFWCFIKKKKRIQTNGHLEFLLCYLLKF